MKKNRTKNGKVKYYLYQKILLRMRLIGLFSFLGIIHVFAVDSYAQSKKMTLELQKGTVLELLRAIEDQSEFYFVYDKNAIDLDRSITIDAKDQTVVEILDNAFKNTGVSYKVYDRNIVLSTLEDSEQSSGISGKVTDSSGVPIPGVSISVKGTSIGTITDSNGNYNLSNVSSEATIVFSFVGMKTQEIVVGTREEINVSLLEESIGLEEVVAIGYGVQKKADLTGAVATVAPEKLLKSTQTLSQALQGQLSGVTIIQNSGEPGGGVQIRVRGAGSINNNTPLYIVDGMIGDITNLNPADIESISVLKDAASAAIYGSRGANGVVIVTTKKGSREGRTLVSYSTTQGVQMPWKMPESLTAEQRNMIHTEALTNDGTAETESVWDYYKNSENVVTRTNWFDEIFRAGYVTTHDVSIQGGSTRSNYMFSLGYLDNNGIVKVSEYKRYNIRFNSQHELLKNLTFGENFSAFMANTQAVDQGPYDGVLAAALFNMRNTPVWEDEENQIYGTPKGDFPNPVASLNSKDYNTKGYGMQGNAYLEYKFLNIFTLKTDYGYMLNLYKTKNFVSVAQNGGRGLDSSSLTETYTSNNTWVWNNTLAFDKTIGQHSISALAGMSMEYGYSEWTSPGTARNFSVFDEAMRYYNNGTTFPGHATGSANDYSLMSYFGRVTYNYGGRYLFAANIRADGSSKFPEDVRWGTFPSFSAGWKVSNESFFEGARDIVSDLKIRASWGQLGNDKINNYYQYYSTISSVESPTLGGASYSAYAQNGMANKNIKWEVTTQTDIGLDLGFLENKINMSLDYFNKETSDILVQVPLVGSLGVGSAPYQNAGKVSNKGFDWDLSYRNTIGDLKYEVAGNISHVKNELVTLGISGSSEIFSANYKNYNVGRIAEGEPIGHFYVLNVLGIFQSESEVNSYINEDGDLIQPYAQPGDLKFEDRNGDGVIGADDRFNAGNSFPTLTYSLNLNLEYKRFDLSMHWTGSQGNKIFNGLTLGEKLMVGTDYNNGTQILDRWTSTNTNTSIPRVSVKDRNGNSQYSTLFIEDGSFFRMKDLTVGYTFKEGLANGNISKLRIYLTCQNLLTFTKYDGFDPEVGSYGSFNDNIYGIDKGIYPQAKSFILGLNLNF